MAGAAAGVVAASIAAGAEPAPVRRGEISITAFSKPFQSMSAEQTAELVAEVGWDGIECPVRSKGQIEPERAEDLLPQFVEALKKRGKAVTIITTDITEVTPLNEKVLRCAAKLGIRKYRLAHVKYERNVPLERTLAELAAKYKDLAALNAELGIQGGYQNHSGVDYVGSALWDIHSVLRQFDVKALASHFDIGHATIEGGMSWATQARLMRPVFGAVYIKDGYWVRGEGGWRLRWCPLGEGIVRKSFIEELKKSGYTGPINQHHEYFASNATRGQMVENFKKDLATLRSWLA